MLVYCAFLLLLACNLKLVYLAGLGTDHVLFDYFWFTQIFTDVICCIFAVIAAHLNIHKIVQGSDRRFLFMVSWFCGEMFSLDICVVVFLWLHSPLDTLLFLGIFFCQKKLY